MRKFPVLKCPVCSKAYKEVGTFGNHMRKEHPGTIPEGWTDLRYAYFVHTGKSHGQCRECKGDTPWNETTGAYAKICGSEACRKQFRDRFMAGMRARYGKANMLDDPNFRQRMLTNRKISGTYKFADGGEVGYMGSLEKAFVQMLDTFFRFPSSDIMSPSPNRYTYFYENENDPEHTGTHYYLPDFYIPSCNLEIELKHPDNQRPKNLMVDVPKDACKDIMMIRNPAVNYVKVYKDDYYVFFQVFADLAQQRLTGETKPIKYISRSLLTSIYREYIPDDCLAILDQYTYKYSEKSVLKKAKESELPVLEALMDEESPEDEDEASILDMAYGVPPEMDQKEANLEEDDSEDQDSVGVNPLLYYSMGVYEDTRDKVAQDSEMAIFNEGNDQIHYAMEAANLEISKDTIDGRAALKYGKWRDKLFGTKLFGKLTSNLFSKVEVNDGRIYIKGINCNLLLYRIKERFSESRLKYIFEYQYNAHSWKLYQKKKIGRGDMKIDYVYAPEFFCLELVEMFTNLGDYYNDQSYRNIATQIYNASWLSKADQVEVPKLGLGPLANLRLDLMDHQKAFIGLWPCLKNQLHLNGFILAFQPGKGKTLTAVGLAECLKAKKVYIVCPNNLKDNWALEIKKYFSKYDDEKLWMKDVCILGTKYGNPDTARYIITNNENIKLMMPVAKADPDCMLIIDECHNFRNYEGGRSTELFQLADKLQSQNVLCVSATPIKAAPSELVPALRLIDPTMTDEAAAMYAKCFNLSDVMAMDIVTKRFGKVIYRPANVQVSLPEKIDQPLKYPISHEDRYYLSTVHDEVINLFKQKHGEWLETVKPIKEDFESSIYKYALTPRGQTRAYIDWVIQASNSLDAANGTDYHELQVKEFMSFIDNCVRPNTSLPMGEADRLQQMQNQFVTACKRHMGQAIGVIYPKRRAEMYIALYEENKEDIYKRIAKRGKKTVIFSTMVPVVKAITKDLNAFGIKAVSITGETKDRLDVINQFREDPNTLVMVATSWCMGVGVTLTEASQLFFFGAPWRSTDYEQASDRIWRIGQTETVNIWNVGAKTKQPNLSDRMEKILEWSAKMFGSAITVTEFEEGQEQPQPAQEYYGMAMLYDIMFEMKDYLSQFQYGMLMDGKIQDPEDKTLYDKHYRTLAPGTFAKAKGGICFDYAAWQDFYLKSHGTHADCWFLEILEPVHRTHTFTTVDDCGRLAYCEVAFKKIEGVYIAESMDELASFIINHMTEKDEGKVKAKLYKMKTNYGRYDEDMDTFLKRVRNPATQVKFKYDPRIFEIREVNPLAEESYGGFNAQLDSHQYRMLNEAESSQLNTILDKISICAHNRSNYVYSHLRETFHVYGSRATNTGPQMASNCYEVAANVVERLGDIPHVNLIMMVEGLMDRTLCHPLICAPFLDSALFVEYGFSTRRNGIYLADKVSEVAQTVANWMALALEVDTSYRISVIQVDDEIIKKTASCISDEEVMALINHLPKRIEVNPNRASELFKVEVYDHGWSVNRF